MADTKEDSSSRSTARKPVSLKGKGKADVETVHAALKKVKEKEDNKKR